MGVYLPTRLGMEEGENPIAMVLTADYSGWMLFFFASGKCAKVPLASYATKQNRRKLPARLQRQGAAGGPAVLPEEQEPGHPHQRRPAAAGGLGPDRRKGHPGQPGRGGGHSEKEPVHHLGPPGGRLDLADPHRYRVRTLPALGALLRGDDIAEQTTLL